VYVCILVSIIMIRLVMCSTRKRCTSISSIHSDYRFWFSFGVNLQFHLKAFWQNLSNSSHTIRRLKFSFTSNFSASFHCKFFVLIVIDNFISISLYIVRMSVLRLQARCCRVYRPMRGTTRLTRRFRQLPAVSDDVTRRTRRLRRLPATITVARPLFGNDEGRKK
jgi:hypothetical protein